MMKILAFLLSCIGSTLRSLPLILIPLLLVSTSATAASVSLGTVSNPRFSSGTLTTATPSSILGDTLSVSLTIGDTSAPVQLFVAAYVPAGSLGVTVDTWFCLTESNGWQSLGTAFTPALSGLLAGNTVQITLARNVNFSSLPKAEVYVGYGTSLNEMLQASRYKAVAAVR